MSLLKMSVSGAVLILAITAVRALAVNRLPKKTFLALWAVALARLLVPYSLPCAWSVYSLAPTPDTAAVPVGTAVAVPETGLHAVLPGPAVSYVPAAPQSVSPWTLLWLAGMLVCAGFFLAAYWSCRRKFRESLPVEDPGALEWLAAHPLRRTVALRQSGRVRAPLTYGILRPVILMPKDTDWRDTENLRFILAHEYVHIRRFDALTKLALTAALCVHWFNPAVWVLYVLANRDLELSCDETVVRQSGARSRTAYAMALLRMEEVKSGLTPLSSNFSRNAIEERIVAIMKMKKTTWAAVFASAILITGVTTAFATSARRGSAEAEDRARNTAVAYENQEVMSYTSPEDGETHYSEDGGATWLTEEEFNKKYPTPDVVWWTAEEYSDWLENEKAELQDMIGERGWTPSTGWFTWDQEKVDETVALYEGILEDIRNGLLVSRTVDGSEDVVLSMGTEETGTALEAYHEGTVRQHPAEPTREELTELYGTFGISIDENGYMVWKNALVRTFVDGVDMGDGAWASHYTYRNDEGTVNLRTVRSRVENADGSYDPFGPLTGIVAYDLADGDIYAAVTEPVLSAEASTAAEGTALEGDVGIDLWESFKKYEPFGVFAVRNGSFGNIYYDGVLVKTFIDRRPDGGITTVDSIGEGSFNVQTVYDENGKLVGVEPEPVLSAEASTVAEGTALEGNVGIDFWESFKKYEPFGVFAVRNGSSGNIYYDGVLVKTFIDRRPDGGITTVGSIGEGSFNVQTVYDENGKLVGVEPVW